MRTSILSLFLLAACSLAYADSVTKKEIDRNGVIYIEEIRTNAKGLKSKVTYPKPMPKTDTYDTPKKTDEVKPTVTTVGPNVKSKQTITQTREQQELFKKNSQNIADAVASCTPFYSSLPDPLIQGEFIKYKVHGLSNGKCKYTQATPRDGITTCLVGDPKRKEIQIRGVLAFTSLLTDSTVCQITGY